MAPSVVQVIHDSLSVVRPSSVAAGNNWDANIFLDHLWKSVGLRSTTLTNDVFAQATGQGAVAYIRGGLIVRSGPSGSPLGMTTSTGYKSYATDVFDNNTSSRIIAIGLEVHNETAEIYKQGHVITYRVMDEPARYPVTTITNAAVYSGTYNGTYNAVELIEPPVTPTEAFDMPGSLQWEAAKGCYVVPRFNAESVDPQDLRPLAVLARENGGTNWFPLIDTVAPFVQLSTEQTRTNALLPITLAGAYFTGLSSETELTVNLTYYVESFPAVDSTLRRLASSDCPEDFAALELYTKIVQHMPTGVEVNDNFLGAFVAGIARVAQAVAPYIPRVINAISGASQIVNAVSQTARRDQAIVRQENGPLAILEPRSNPGASGSRNQPRITVTHPDEEIIVRNSPKVEEVVIRRPESKSAPRKNATRVTRNKRNKDFSRLDKYIKASNAGNRTIM